MPLFEVQNALRHYGEVHALDGVSFSVEAGRVLGLLGPNGAGKSTLIRAITTLEKLDSGSIRISGVEVGEDPARARGFLGYAGQESAVDKIMTGREFLRFQAGLVHLPKSESRPRIEELLRRFDLMDAADRRTEGYSGGMRRRLDLAASLMHHPRLLILDEPSSGLDYDARRRLWDILRGLRAEGTALLLATHDFEEAEELSDEVVLMSHGKVVAEGSPDSLRTALGSWILSAALSELPREGDHDRLAALFGGFPGKALPPDPSRSDFRFAVAEERSSRVWVDQLEEHAAHAGVELYAVGARRPTLQDVYLAAVGAPLANGSEEAMEDSQ